MIMNMIMIARIITIKINNNNNNDNNNERNDNTKFYHNPK